MNTEQTAEAVKLDLDVRQMRKALEIIRDEAALKSNGGAWAAGLANLCLATLRAPDGLSSDNVFRYLSSDGMPPIDRNAKETASLRTASEIEAERLARKMASHPRC